MADLKKLEGLGWQSLSQGQQVEVDGGLPGIIGYNQYSPGDGDNALLFIDPPASFLLEGFGGSLLEEEIRPLFSIEGFTGASLVYEMRPLITSEIHMGRGILEEPVPLPDVFGQTSDADDGLFYGNVHYPTVDAFTGPQLSGQLPVPFIAASGTVSGIGKLDSTFTYAVEGVATALITMFGEGTGGRIGGVDALIEIPTTFSIYGETGYPFIIPPFFNLRLDGRIDPTARAELEETVPRIRMLASGMTAEVVGRLDEVIPPVFIDKPGFLDKIIPLIRITATSGEVTEPLYAAYAVNTKRNALTIYRHWPFTHIVRFRGQYVGVSTAGIFAIGADDADGVEFNYEFKVPSLNFGVTSLKRLVHFHVTQRRSGRMLLATAPDEGSDILYDVNGLTDDGIRTRRKKLMKGPRAHYWSIKVQGMDGEGLDLDNIELRAHIIHGRRLK